MPRSHRSNITPHAGRTLGVSGVAVLCGLACLIFCGCEGATVKDDNPVFAAAPPRSSLTNRSPELRVADREDAGNIRQIGLTAKSSSRLTGSSVVATVNGRPLFLDDVIPEYRRAVDADENLADDQRNMILREKLRTDLTKRIDQELLLQKMSLKIPPDREAGIEETLEPHFQTAVLERIRADTGAKDDVELAETLAKQFTSIEDLRTGFMRYQKADGFLAATAEVDNVVDRDELLAWYEAHIEEFTPPERVQWREIIVRFENPGERAVAEQTMTKVVTELQSGEPFDLIARKYSQSVTAQDGGDNGWLQRGGLKDQELEDKLFSLPKGGLTRVFVRDNRFELFQVADREEAISRPFSEAQQEIKQTIVRERTVAARTELMKKYREEATITTLFDDEER